GQVLKFRQNDVFFPEVTLAMGEAYDAAIATLPPDARSIFYFRKRIAMRIIKAARLAVGTPQFYRRARTAAGRCT
ncbi:MAG: hypothetical protein WA728_01895, partial [Xanthobacteraceae bacterium]